jgi:hypothetical protein
MLKTAPPPVTSVGYDDDFVLWTQDQARLLREKRFADLDLANLIEEVESVGRSERREIRSRLEVLIAHLLKWMIQPEGRKTGWSGTIAEQRRRLQLTLEDSPSLRRYPVDQFAKIYDAARLAAAKETGITYAAFPSEAPFTVEQVLDDDFLPEDPDRLGARRS